MQALLARCRRASLIQGFGSSGNNLPGLRHVYKLHSLIAMPPSSPITGASTSPKLLIQYNPILPCNVNLHASNVSSRIWAWLSSGSLCRNGASISKTTLAASRIRSQKPFEVDLNLCTWVLGPLAHVCWSPCALTLCTRAGMNPCLKQEVRMGVGQLPRPLGRILDSIHRNILMDPVLPILCHILHRCQYHLAANMWP